MKTNDIEAIYPLSPMQQGMLFHSLLDPETQQYLEQLSVRLVGDLDVPAFQRAWQQVVDRHAILRTAFAWKRVNQNLQAVHRRVALPFLAEDLRGLPAAEQQQRIEAYRAADRAKGFELSKAPLMRLAVFTLTDTTAQLIWTHHHILLDGWSVPLLIGEVMALYEAHRHGLALEMPAPRPYRGYIAWLQKQDQAKAEAFWRQKLTGFTAPTPLGIDLPWPADPDEDPSLKSEVVRVTSPALLAAAQNLARANGLTLSLVVQAAWAILLARYSREEEVLFGMTFSGRSAHVPGIEEMIGLLINTLPVRVSVDPRRPLLPWLRELRENQAELSQYEYCALVDIQRWSEVPAAQPLFESLFVFENFPLQAQPEQEPSLSFEAVQSIERTNYPIALIASARDSLELKASYDPARVNRESAARMLGHLETLLQAITANPNALIGELPLLTPAEREQILVAWNQTSQPYDASLCAHEVFRKMARRMPGAVALEFEERALTFAELDLRSDQFARRLARAGAKPESLVAVLLDRSPEMVIAMLGALKAGAAFLPLDPSYPPERLAYMLSDSAAGILVTDRARREAFPGISAQVICLEADWPAVLHEGTGPLPQCAGPHNLAYVIYTSGSTGKPKGTLLEHRGLVNLVNFQSVDYHIGPGKRVLQFASCGFDASVAEIFTTLCSGGTLVLARKETLTSLPELTQLLREKNIHNVTLPPSLLAILPADEFPALEVVITAGEACPLEVANRWVVGRTLINGYGPTEATVCSAGYSMTAPLTNLPRLPIGRPLTNTRAYVLDANLQPLPVGIPGELHVGGVSLGRGYLNRPDLTAEKFIPDPFSPADSVPASRLYKTGDLVRWLPDGNLDFLGRIDLQVKIRGFRIELGEIESALLQHPNVLQAAVNVYTSGGDKRLAAYLVLRDPGAAQQPEALQAELRDFLSTRLPDYMVPAAYVVMSALPLSSAGKVNRKALPQPDPEQWAARGAEPTRPGSQAEELLVGIWSTVLNLEAVGANTNFFEAGGHSLLAMRVVSLIRDAFQVEVPIRTLFEHPTPAEMAAEIAGRRGADGAALKPRIQPVERGGQLPLSFPQERLWFLDQLEPGNPFYNLPAAVRLKGALDVAALEGALQAILRRHEALRTRFIDQDGRPLQTIQPDGAVALPLTDLSALPPAEREATLRDHTMQACLEPFNLAGDLLLRANLYRLAEDEHVLVLILHHIVADGWSLEVLVRDLAALYAGAAALPELPVQYPDFAAWQRDWLQGQRMEEQLAYWKTQLTGIPPLLELPTDHPRPAVQDYRGAMLAFTLPGETAHKLRAFCKKEGVTLYMALLALYQALLYRYSGQEDVLVGTAIANRDQHEVQNLIGFFVNNLVLRGDLSGEPSFRELLKRTRKVCLDAYAHQDLPFEILVDALRPERNQSHSPVFQAAFDLQAQTEPSLDMPGLQVEPLVLHNGTASFDLLLSFTDTGAELHGALEYAASLFEPATIQRLIEHYQVLIETALTEPDRPLTRLGLLTPAERQVILSDWNATAHPYFDGLAHQLFEGWARRQPDAPALVFEGRPLSYRALDRRASALAHRLRGLGVTPETPVAILCRRGFDMITAMLGVLKAGAAFLPLDPAYPPERLAFMLEDSQASILITHDPLAEQLALPLSAQVTSVFNARVLCLDGEGLETEVLPGGEPNGHADPASLAYLIYTSGSTGKPKGTLLHHRGLCNLIEYQRCTFNITPGTRVLQFSSSSFDASVWEVFMALGNGGTLVLASQEVLASPPDLLALLREQAVNVVTLPPSVLSILPPAELPALRTIVAAGEACPAELPQAWGASRQFFNAYGPTETTVCASAAQCDPASPLPPPIGKPVFNMQLYVLDPHMQPLPAGVPGELYVGGDGVARGYLNRPEMSEARFLPDPFAAKPGARLYKTGDRVRWRADGSLEFLGRLDQQVKLRGFRIELGEIEATLMQFPGVRQTVVMVREDTPNNRRLAAYLVLEPGQPEPERAALRDFLAARLPEYMVPPAYVILEALPLNPNGKVDRAKLPAAQPGEGSRTGTPPRTETEIELARICRELLQVEQVWVEDNFFDLGGHSLLATQFVSQAREAFQVELPVRALFEQPTIAALAALIDQSKPQNQTELDSIAALLGMVEESSPEEIRRLLESEGENPIVGAVE